MDHSLASRRDIRSPSPRGESSLRRADSREESGGEARDPRWFVRFANSVGAALGAGTKRAGCGSQAYGLAGWGAGCRLGRGPYWGQRARLYYCKSHRVSSPADNNRAERLTRTRDARTLQCRCRIPAKEITFGFLQNKIVAVRQSSEFWVSYSITISF